ncbi:uncharacterized protein ACWYII_045342 [Salvelinus alpinus]
MSKCVVQVEGAVSRVYSSLAPGRPVPAGVQGSAPERTREVGEGATRSTTGSTDHKREEGGCGKQCAETVSELQKKSQDLRRHLENACRQLQENKASMQHLKDDHEVALWKEKEHNLQELEEVKRCAAKESSGRPLWTCLGRPASPLHKISLLKWT